MPISEAEDRSTKGMFVDEVVAYWYARYPWTGPSAEDVVGRLLDAGGRARGERGSAAARRASRARPHERARPVALASSTPLALIDRCLDHFDLAIAVRDGALGGVRALRQAPPRRLPHRRGLARRRSAALPRLRGLRRWRARGEGRPDDAWWRCPPSEDRVAAGLRARRTGAGVARGTASASGSTSGSPRAPW